MAPRRTAVSFAERSVIESSEALGLEIGDCKGDDSCMRRETEHCGNREPDHRVVPRWDTPNENDMVAWLLDDLAAAEALWAELPPGSRDAALVARTIDELHHRLADLLRAHDARTADRSAGGEGMSKDVHRDDTDPHDVIRHLADWRRAEQLTSTAAEAVAAADDAVVAATRAADLADRVATSAARALAAARDTTDHATETAETLHRDATVAVDVARAAAAAAKVAGERAAAAKAAFDAARETAFAGTGDDAEVRRELDEPA